MNPKYIFTPLLIGIYLLVALINIQGVLISVSFLSLIYGIWLFLKSRKSIKSALYYSRVAMNWKQVVLIIAILVLFITMLFFIPKRFLADPGNPNFAYVLVVMFAITLGNYYQNYNNSVRAFKNGILEPGWGKDLINWNDIKSLKRNGNEVFVNGNSYVVDKKDTDDFDAIIELWKNEKCL